MNISLTVTQEQANIIMQAADISGELVEQIALDGAYWRACDIIRTSKIITNSHENKVSAKYCSLCKKQGVEKFAAQCSLCKRCISRIHFEPKRKKKGEDPHVRQSKGRFYGVND